MAHSVLLTRTYAFPGGTSVTPFKTVPQQVASEVVMADHPPSTIYGIDEMQAAGPSIQFIESMLPAFNDAAEWTLLE